MASSELSISPWAIWQTDQKVHLKFPRSTKPVLGRYDAELEFPAKDVDAAKAALKTIGFELIEAERPIQMLEVSPREKAPKAEETKPQVPPQK
jgi:hypothetical protein